MKLTDTGRKKALIVVDVQPAFIRPHNKHIIPRIVSLIKQVPYDLYIAAVFHAEKGSLWEVQQDWLSPMDDETHTVEPIAKALEPHNPVRVLKTTRSAFKGEPDIKQVLKEHGIEEVHLVGTETNDCVFATAFDAFDNGFIPYILEECCESATEGRHEQALPLVRYQGMSNNHCPAETVDITVEE